MGLTRQRLGLEVPNEDEQVQQHKRSRKHDFECTFHQRNGDLAHAHCFEWVLLAFRETKS